MLPFKTSEPPSGGVKEKGVIIMYIFPKVLYNIAKHYRKPGDAILYRFKDIYWLPDFLYTLYKLITL